MEERGRTAQMAWLVQQVTGDESATPSAAWADGECEYGELDVKGATFHVYKFMVRPPGVSVEG